MESVTQECGFRINCQNKLELLSIPRAPRVPPSPTSNSKTSGAGAGDQLRLKRYEISRSTPVQDARIPSEGNLRSTKVLRKVGGVAEVPPASQ